MSDDMNSRELDLQILIAETWLMTTRARKRRKVITDLEADKVLTTRADFQLRLGLKDLHDLKLTNPIIISLGKLEYFTFNSEKTSYIYYLCFCLFEVRQSQVNILYSPNGSALDDNSEEWIAVEEDGFRVPACSLTLALQTLPHNMLGERKSATTGF